MEQDLVSLFGYALDNWFICISVLSIALSAHIKRDRSIILFVTFCAVLGHYLSPYFFGIIDSWKYWGLFGSSVAFLKLMGVILLIKKNELYRTSLAEWLCFIFIVQIAFHGFSHLDWAVLETEFLLIPIFTIELFGKSIAYDAYKLIAQALNAMVLLSIYGNWLLKLVNHGENNGKCQSGSDSNDFYARLRSI